MSVFRKVLILMVVMFLVPAARAAGDLERSFSFPSGGLLEIDTDLGHIEIRTGSSDQVHVRVTASRGELADVLNVRFEEGPGLRIEGREVRRGGDHGGVKFEIDAPKWMDLHIEDGGGHVSVEDLEGEMRIHTGGGHIKFADVGGPVHVKTGGGHIEGRAVRGEFDVSTGGGHISVEDVAGDVSVSTGGGHVTVGDVGGKVSAHSGGGHIQLGRVTGDIEIDSGGGHLQVAASAGDVEAFSGGGEITLDAAAGYVLAHTGGGDIRVALTEGNGAGADLESGKEGDIFLTVPPGVGFEVDARAAGRVDASLPFQGKRQEDRLDGTIGGGGNLLKLHAKDGDVRIDTR